MTKSLFAWPAALTLLVCGCSDVKQTGPSAKTSSTPMIATATPADEAGSVLGESTVDANQPTNGSEDDPKSKDSELNNEKESTSTTTTAATDAPANSETNENAEPSTTDGPPIGDAAAVSEGPYVDPADEPLVYGPQLPQPELDPLNLWSQLTTGLKSRWPEWSMMLQVSDVRESKVSDKNATTATVGIESDTANAAPES